MFVVKQVSVSNIYLHTVIATLLDAAKPRPSGALMVTRVNNIICRYKKDDVNGRMIRV